MTSAVFFVVNRCAARIAAWCGASFLTLALVGCASSDKLTAGDQPAGAAQSLGTSISTLGGWLSPYRADVLQGNVITKEQAQQLRVGLSRDQVAGVLGTPLLKSVFHSNRWDYVFTWARQGSPDQQRRLTVWFEQDKLAKFVGDDMPSEQEFVQSISRPVDTSASVPLQATPEQLQRFQAQQDALKASSSAPAATNATTPSATSYPALNAPIAQGAQ